MTGVHTLVLAAGRSTRLAGEIDGGSKVLVDVGGQTVLERNLRWLAESGIQDVWVNLHHRARDVEAIAGNGAQLGLHVHYHHEPELLGTAGTYRALASTTPGTWLVVYGDNVSRFSLSSLVDNHRASGGIATIALFDQRVHANSGIAGGKVVVEHGFVTAFSESANGMDSSLVNAGVYALEPAVLDYVPPGTTPDFGKDVFPALLRAGEKLRGHVIEPGGYCFGIDTPQALQRMREALSIAKGAPR